MRKLIGDIEEGLYLVEHIPGGREIHFQVEDRAYPLATVESGEVDLQSILDTVELIAGQDEDCLDENIGEIVQALFDYVYQREPA